MDTILLLGQHDLKMSFIKDISSLYKQNHLKSASNEEFDVSVGLFTHAEETFQLIGMTNIIEGVIENIASQSIGCVVFVRDDLPEYDKIQLLEHVQDLAHTYQFNYIIGMISTADDVSITTLEMVGSLGKQHVVCCSKKEPQTVRNVITKLLEYTQETIQLKDLVQQIAHDIQVQTTEDIDEVYFFTPNGFEYTYHFSPHATHLQAFRPKYVAMLDIYQQLAYGFSNAPVDEILIQKYNGYLLCLKTDLFTMVVRCSSKTSYSTVIKHVTHKHLQTVVPRMLIHGN